jgi:hypothetical protein
MNIRHLIANKHIRRGDPQRIVSRRPSPTTKSRGDVSGPLRAPSALIEVLDPMLCVLQVGIG